MRFVNYSHLESQSGLGLICSTVGNAAHRPLATPLPDISQGGITIEQPRSYGVRQVLQ
jgi:hypothetical protein